MLIHPLSCGNQVMVSCIKYDVFHLRYFHCLVETSEGRQPISVRRIVVIRTAIGVDITKVIRVAGIRRALPPVSG